jgi:DNA-binding HxlR family transcriptional regulator
MQAGERLLESLHKYQVWNARCPSRRVLDLIADKWTTLVLVSLATGPKYYSQLKRDVSGISHKMLSQTVRTLERYRFVVRTVYPAVPPRVEYTLTPLAETLIPTLNGLIGWAETHAAEFPLLDPDAVEAC